MVRSEFLNTLKRLMALDYENIVLRLSGPSAACLRGAVSRFRVGGSSYTTPALGGSCGGMVDLVARIVADGDDRQLSFKTSEVIFGGGRLTVHNKEIPLDWKESSDSCFQPCRSQIYTRQAS